MKMKNLLATAVLCATALGASAEEGIVRATVTNAVPEKSLKVLMIGNSFSVQMATSLPPVAQNLGQGLDICSMYIGGCTFDRHWKNVSEATNKPYSVQWNCRGKANDPTFPVAGVCVRSTDEKNQRFGAWKANIPEVLSCEKWDVVTIQQGSHKSWQSDTYHPYADDLVKTIRERAPQAKIVVHETWSYTPFDKRLKGWKIDQNEMYAKLHAAYADFAGKYGFEIIPTGAAVQAWRKRLPVSYGERDLGGDVCGALTFEQDPATGAWKQSGDPFHMNFKGNHLQALVWAAKLFGVDVTKCTYVPPVKKDKHGVEQVISEKEAALMRTIAMDVVRGQKN